MCRGFGVIAFACVSAWGPAALGYGEADAEGRPSAEERRLHLLTNQVRAEPHAYPGWDTRLAGPEPRSPLVLEQRLAAAARFHAVDMSTAGCFQHSSCDGTPFSSRISRFFDGPAGENIAKGYPSAEAVMVGWMNSPGHRQNILEPSWNVLGTGAATGDHWVQNFGRMGSMAVPPIVAAAVFTEPSGLRLAAHAYDAAGRSPNRFEAVLDGTPVALAPVAGLPGHRTWEARVSAPPTCRDLVFFLEDATGTEHRYPSTGVLLAGAGCSTSFRPGASTPDPSRPVVEADEGSSVGGCRCATESGFGAASPWLLLGLGLIAARRLRRSRR